MNDKIEQFLKENFSDAFVAADTFRGMLSVQIDPAQLKNVCQALQEDSELDIKYLSDITVVDWFEHDQASRGRYEVVYNLYSFRHKHRFFIKIRLNEDNTRVDSLIDLWAGANWMEREAYDLFGIEFEGHPDLRKILTPEDLEGHPLRKDFPLTYEQPRFTWNKDDPPEVIR